MDCLARNRARFAHPYTHEHLTVSLAPDDVIGFVFWSKDFRAFHPALQLVRERGTPFYCLYTITGLAAPFEQHAASLDERIEDFQRLSEEFGPDRMSWRFDPIVISSLTPPRETQERFAYIARRLSACTRDCIVSFMQSYPHVARRVQELSARRHVIVHDPPPDDKRALLCALAARARTYGIRVRVCCQDDLIVPPLAKAHCVDSTRVRQLSGAALPDVPRRGTRRQCGCSASCDIGTYQSCPHECVYCYARGGAAVSHRTPVSSPVTLPQETPCSSFMSTLM